MGKTITNSSTLLRHVLLIKKNSQRSGTSSTSSSHPVVLVLSWSLGRRGCPRYLDCVLDCIGLHCIVINLVVPLRCSSRLHTISHVSGVPQQVTGGQDLRNKNVHLMSD